MMALTEIQWLLVAVLAALHLATCYRVPRWAKLTGRSPLLWFSITLLLTSVPAAIVCWRDRKDSSRQAAACRRIAPSATAGDENSSQRRCPHCGVDMNLPGAKLESLDGADVCPHCGLAVGEDFLA